MIAREQDRRQFTAARESRPGPDTLSVPHSAVVSGRAAAASNGATLVEALTVIALTLIVGVIAVPTTAAMARSYRLHAATGQLGLDIMRARTIAIARNTDVRLVFHSRGYLLEQRDAASGSWLRAQGFVSLPSVLTLVAEKTTLTFTGSGITTGNRIVLSNGERRKVIEVSRLGRVSVT